MAVLNCSLDQLMKSGYVLLHGVYSQQQTESLAERLSEALYRRDDPAVLRSRGRIYGSRHLIAAWPEVRQIPWHPQLEEFVTAVLGPSAGLVRALFFDKPPDRSWSLPWHRDRTIAVKNNELATSVFQKPTVKAGIPHVEAPDSILTNMLTLRLHLDAMTSDNGPLSVIPGSHRTDRESTSAPQNSERMPATCWQ